MKLIVGLGNPGKQYDKTRHNAGFFVVDKVAEKLGVDFDKSKCKAIYGIYRHKGEKIIIAKPQTFMNLSGESVLSLLKFYDMDIDDLIVIHDDMDLPLGKLRLRRQGSSAGQKGMGNIIDLLGTSEIKRIRMGISKDEKIDTINWVLGHFSAEEMKIFDEAADKAAEAVIYGFNHDFEDVMNKYNR